MLKYLLRIRYFSTIIGFVIVHFLKTASRNRRRNICHNERQEEKKGGVNKLLIEYGYHLGCLISWKMSLFTKIKNVATMVVFSFTPV